MERSRDKKRYIMPGSFWQAAVLSLGQQWESVQTVPEFLRRQSVRRWGGAFPSTTQ